MTDKRFCVDFRPLNQASLEKDSEGNVTDKRFCVDFRPLNQASHTDRYGMHSAEELLCELYGSKYFTTIYMRAGYHQIPVAPKDIPKTTFWWLNRLYAYTRMPFGAKNASAHFQRIMDTEVLCAGLQAFCIAFVDDMLVHSRTAEERSVVVKEAPGPSSVTTWPQP